jgi:hypothetical protein
MSEQHLKCPFCPVTSSHGAGLASHIRSAHSKQHAGWSKARKSGAVHKQAAASSPAPGFSGVVASLQRQKDAIDSALAALRAIGDSAAAPVQRKRGRPRKVQ